MNPAVRPADVEAAIKRATACLYGLEKNGNWESSPAPSASEKEGSPNGGQWGGHTALAVDALLAAGEDPQDARLAPAIQFLLKAEIRGSYALGIRCQVWLQLPLMREAALSIRRDAATLLAMMKTTGDASGMWDYVQGRGRSTYSHSRSQYAVLGLWAADQMGVARSDEAWKMIEDGWIRHQDASGGWAYTAAVDEKYPLTPGMTAAGVATLFITQTMLQSDRSAGTNAATAAIDKGLAWLADNGSLYASETAYPRDYPHTTLYTFERAAMASGRKYIGNIDWWNRGASYLLRRQNPDGSWSGRSGGLDETSIPDICFGLLFLSHGRAPIVFDKLQYGTADTAVVANNANQDQRTQDVANVTAWIGKELERPLSWQVVSLDGADQDLCDAPILYITGRQRLTFSEPEMGKLRLFVEQGGLILGNAEGGSDAFSNSFRKLGGKLFPDYEFRNLPMTHSIYTLEPFPAAKWTRKPGLLGLSNGVRELMILVPAADIGKAWQQLQSSTRKEAFEVAGDILLYAADRGAFRLRGEYNVVTPDPAVVPNRKLHIAQLYYAGNFNPEPGGWRRLAALMLNDHQVQLDIKTIPLGKGQLDSVATAKSTIAFLTGTTKFEFTADQQTELKAFVGHGGTLLVDAAGGSTAFSVSAQAAIVAALGGAFHDLPADDPLYAGLPAPTRSLFREFAKIEIGAGNRQYRLRGLDIDGRTAVVFSRYDLSNGIVGQPFDGVVGYTPAAATALLEQLLTNWSKDAEGPSN